MRNVTINSSKCVERVQRGGSSYYHQCKNGRKHGNFCGTHYKKYMKYRRDNNVLVQNTGFGGALRQDIDNALSVGLTIVAKVDGEVVPVSTCPTCYGVTEDWVTREGIRCTCHDFRLDDADVRIMIDEINSWEDFASLVTTLNKATHLQKNGEVIRAGLNPVYTVALQANRDRQDTTALGQKMLLQEITRRW